MMFRQDGHFFLTLAALLTVSQMFGALSHTRSFHRWPRAVFFGILGQVVALGVVGHLRRFASSAPDNANVDTSAFMGAFALAHWSLVAAVAAARSPTLLAKRTVGILGVISFGYLVCLLLPAEPWSLLPPLAGRGAGIAGAHEPGNLYRIALHAGSAGLAVPFASAVAALLENATDHSWARYAFGWSLAVWACLSLAVVLSIGLAAHPHGAASLETWAPGKWAVLTEWLGSAALLYLLCLAVWRGICGGWALLLATTLFPATCLGLLLVPLRTSAGAVAPHALEPAGDLLALMLVHILLGGALVLYAWKRVIADLV